VSAPRAGEGKGDRALLIATRASELAVRQARQVQEALAQRGVTAELKTYRTTGDKRLDEPLSAIGGKGLFTRELESDLAKGVVDCCVHSLKDLPTEGPRGLTIAAVLEREDPRDVLIVNSIVGVTTLGDLPAGSRVGTSSLRRRAQLLATRSDLDVVELRGNVPTRIKNVDDGHVHAAILAAAGLHRLGVPQHIASYLDAPAWLPAAGQGAIAVQIRDDDTHARSLIALLDDARTHADTNAERAFLAALEGGCQVPIGALVVDSAGDRVLHGFIGDVRGKHTLRSSLPLDDRNPELTGVRLANELRHQGASDILESLRRADKIPSPQPE
jgi:hydroxymethylbilane synthase